MEMKCDVRWMISNWSLSPLVTEGRLWRVWIESPYFCNSLIHETISSVLYLFTDYNIFYIFWRSITLYSVCAIYLDSLFFIQYHEYSLTFSFCIHCPDLHIGWNHTNQQLHETYLLFYQRNSTFIRIFRIYLFAERSSFISLLGGRKTFFTSYLPLDFIFNIHFENKKIVTNVLKLCSFP